MKKSTVGICILIVSIAMLFACQHYGGKEKQLPSPMAGQFWNYITETSSYTQWDYFPGYEGMYPGESPHGAYLKLYVNDIAYEAIENGEPMPDGAILVKENYGKDQKTLKAITPMYKVEGYNPEGGNWYWAKFGPGGTALESGQVASCIQCHKTAGGDDYLITEPQ